jgi:hypothetical protein
MLSASTDAAAGAWVVTGVRDFDYTVGSVVPAVFDAYARVFHPGSRGSGENAVEVRWAEVAAANGRLMHAAAEWGSLTGSWQLEGQPGVWDQGPRTGELPELLAMRLAAILENHTGANRCFFGVWEGWGTPSVTMAFHERTPDEVREWQREAVEAEIAGWCELIGRGVSLRLPDRPMWVLEGPVAAVGDFYAPYRNRPSLWWPEDRAWCVGTDIDLMTTYVGGTSELIDALLADDQLESFAVSVDQRIDWKADTINPLPGPP